VMHCPARPRRFVHPRGRAGQYNRMPEGGRSGAAQRHVDLNTSGTHAIDISSVVSQSVPFAFGGVQGGRSPSLHR
jgi:hypothetical protein